MSYQRFLLIYNALKLVIIAGKNNFKGRFIQLRAVPVGTALRYDSFVDFLFQIEADVAAEVFAFECHFFN